jgi:sugar phosphate isomerase/epimerase
MRLAFSTLACPDWPFERVVEVATEHGYEGIELRVLEGELVSPALPDADRRRVRAALEAAGLCLCCVDTSVEIAGPDQDMEEALACVELAAALGAPLIRLFPGAPGGEPAETTARRTVERLSALARRGRELGVRIGVETHDSFATGDITARMLAGAPPDVGVIWDTLNTVVAGEAPEVTFPLIAERLVHVHVKDGGSAPDPEENRLLGDGEVPIESIVRTLAAHRYEGWLSVEWEKLWQPEIADATVALPQYAGKLRPMLARTA